MELPNKIIFLKHKIDLLNESIHIYDCCSIELYKKNFYLIDKLN